MADDSLGNGYPARIARLEEKVKHVEVRLQTMPSEAQVAVLSSNMTTMGNEITRQGKAFDQFVEDWKQEQTDEQGRRASRSVAMTGWVIALICCIIGSATLVLVSVHI